MILVPVWNEYRDKRENEAAKESYPDGNHAKLADVHTDYRHDGRGSVPSTSEDAFRTNLVTEAAIESAQSGDRGNVEVCR